MKNKSNLKLVLCSLIALVISMTCFVSYTLSWITTSENYELDSVQFASYTIENETIQKEKLEEDLVKYTIQLTAKGDAQTGYCKITIKNKDYYTEPIEPENSLIFSVILSKQDYKQIEYSAQWGIYEGEADIEEGVMMNEKGKIVQDEESTKEVTTEIETETESETEEITTEVETETTKEIETETEIEVETESETEISQTKEIEESSQEE